ncbi:MAG: DUF615 domain-containing protein [Kangiellaceae bacterium]|nr:DUF615 domain-containing protein [Kangiellaceae bacterium]
MNQEYLQDQEKSKTEIKKEMLEITKLGQRLVDLNSTTLDKVPLSEVAYKAIIEGQKIKHHTGLKRHLKYVGKILRDENVEAIKQFLNTYDQRHLAQVKELHLAEQWRERLLAQGDSAIFELLQISPTLDRQKLRQLVRSAQKEMSLQNPAKYQRELYRYIKENVDFTEL